MIVGIGANVYDTLITLSNFPKEDTKMRAESITASGGGPCATGLCAASVLGADTAYLGNLADDPCGQFLKSDMEKYGTNTDFVNVMKDFSSFTSCIWLNKSEATRTCVFHKGTLPPLVLNDRQKDAIKNADVLLVDGNDLYAAIEGAKIARQNNTKVLYDAGGLYEGIENLLPLTDILIPSAEFAMGHTNCDNIKDAAIKLYDTYKPEVVVITDGKNGGIMYDGSDIIPYDAFKVDAVDSNGAGDVFHGAFAFCVNMGYNYKKCCVFSSAVSALKCCSVGARASVPDYKRVIDFLKERYKDEL